MGQWQDISCADICWPQPGCRCELFRSFKHFFICTFYFTLMMHIDNLFIMTSFKIYFTSTCIWLTVLSKDFKFVLFSRIWQLHFIFICKFQGIVHAGSIYSQLEFSILDVDEYLFKRIQVLGIFYCFQCVKFHPNCNYLATGSSDRSVRLWTLQDGKSVRLMHGHRGTIMSLAFSPNGNFLASAGTIFFTTREQIWCSPQDQCTFIK